MGLFGEEWEVQNHCFPEKPGSDFWIMELASQTCSWSPARPWLSLIPSLSLTFQEGQGGEWQV